MKQLFLFCMLATAVFGWQRIFDFSIYRTVFRDFIELSDGTSIVVMTTSGMLDSTDNTVYVVGLNETGDSLWTRNFGFFTSPYGGIGSVVSDSDTTYIFATVLEVHSYYVIFSLVKMNQHGDIIWSHVDSSDGYGYGDITDIDHEGNILSLADWWLVKFTGDGEFIDDFGISAYGWDFRIRYGYDMRTVKFPPYGVVIVGEGLIPGFDDYIGYMIYLDAEYDSVWSIYYGTTGPITGDHDALYGVEVVSNPVRGYPRGFIGVGTIYNTSDFNHLGYIVRTDMDGNIIWERQLGLSEDDALRYEFYDIVWTGREEFQTSFAVVGKRYSSPSEAVLCIISDTLDGDTLWTKTYEVGTEETIQDAIRKVVACRDGGFLLGGLYDESADMSVSTWLCRVDSLGNDVPYSIEEPHVSDAPLPEQLEVVVFPNPFNSTVEISVTVPQGTDNISLTIYDITGKMIKELTGIAGNIFRWDGTDQKGNTCPTGAYLYKATCGDRTVTDNILYVK